MENVRLSPVPPALLERLGKVIVGWGVIEAYVAEMLAALLMADRGSMYLVTADTGVAPQIKWVRQVVTLRMVGGEVKEDLLHLLADLDEIRSERNVLVHGVWREGPEPDTAIVQTARLDRVEMIKNELVSVAEMDELNEEIRNAIGRLSLAMYRLSSLKYVAVDFSGDAQAVDKADGA